MFLENKHTLRYFKIIKKAQGRNHLKTPRDGFQLHHIIPRSLGGSDDSSNLVYLSYKEHKLCHRLLIEMTSGVDRQKMSYAYSWFGDSAGNYKTGQDNNFSKPEIIEMVRKRMKEKNPMKDPSRREHMSLTNHRNKAIATPAGIFHSRAAALRHHGFKHWKILYDLMSAYPDQYYWITPSSSTAAER